MIPALVFPAPADVRFPPPPTEIAMSAYEGSIMQERDEAARRDGVVCKGSYALGTACGRCPKCQASAPPQPAFGPSLPVADVARQAHYTALKIQPVEFIAANGLGFLAGNVIKYVCRYPYKNGVEDLRKARVYLDWLIAEAEGKPLDVPKG